MSLCNLNDSNQLMSKISNKLIELKLREVLQLQADANISKFDDNTALNVIFAEYQDRIEFTDAALDRMTEEIEELKLAEVQLRNQLKYVQLKQSRFNSEKDDQYLPLLKYRQENKKLLQTLDLQSKQFQTTQKQNKQLQKKIFQLIQQVDSKVKQLQDTRIQLESQKEKEKEYKSTETALRKQIERINLQNQQDMQKYKNEFLENLKQTLKATSEKEAQQNLKLAQKLQLKFNQHQKILKQVITTVNKLFRLNQSAEGEINNWLELFQSKFESYNRQIVKASTNNTSLKDSKNPIKQLAELQKKKLLTRDALISNYIN